MSRSVQELVGAGSLCFGALLLRESSIVFDRSAVGVFVISATLNFGFQKDQNQKRGWKAVGQSSTAQLHLVRSALGGC